ncbi:uncharacterized protein MELLADRAFT_90516 [Melampsora larici-populina 98AG31]|nr:uncharacterized protein MELLADRAFT_90516 [Melampsora larici-populina 98AG31]EGG02913.1 hypothetical protein MELLADRAFT_90516 [Melampsora larici-populina 98AG31]
MARFDEINNFDQAEHPEDITDAHFLDYLEQGKQLSTNPQSSKPLTYRGKTVMVTGAGNGLGTAYALMYGKLGANVVVNDMNSEAASKVVDEIKHLGAKAVANTSSVEDEQKVVKAALDNFGSLHVIVNNAGILSDKSFISMTNAEWDIIQKVHLR